MEATDGSGNVQRQFARKIISTPANEIRKSATAAMKAAKEQATPKVRVVDPIDYEGELTARKKDVEKEKYLPLLLFPQQDVTVTSEGWNYRTHTCSVPEDAHHPSLNLLASECLKFYTSKWNKVVYSNASEGPSPTRPDYTQVKSNEFEVDHAEAEELAAHSAQTEPKVGTSLNKKGFLHKGPFPTEGFVKTFRYQKRWAVLSGNADQGYILNFYKDEKSSSVKATVMLENCAVIKKNSKHKTYGFDLLGEDDRTIYPLATDSDSEADSWISILSKAIGLEDETSQIVHPTRLSYDQSTLKENKIQMQLESSPQSVHRHPVFQVYPDLMRGDPSDDRSRLRQAPEPEEHFGLRFMVKCKDVRFKFMVERDGKLDHVEPFFFSLALYDAQNKVKISEDFHFDLNSPSLRGLLPLVPDSGVKAPHPLSQMATSATQSVFSVSCPHQNVYLVLKVDKVLQDNIATCSEPYLKGENPKAAQKLVPQIQMLCSTIGQYRMPFAWAARALFTSSGDLDTSAQFSSLIRQEREKLSSEELMKILAEFRSANKPKLQTIPGSIDIDVLPLEQPPDKTGILTPSLLPVKAAPSDFTDSPPMLEVQEFPLLESPEWLATCHAYLTFQHHFYVYPEYVKFDSQKQAKNITCCVQFKSSDDEMSEPLPVIYSRAVGPVFTDRINTAVLHHCTTPSFAEEVKVKLPVSLSEKHHLLFTFYNISCNMQKHSKTLKATGKANPVETPVGYAWLPLLNKDGSVVVGAQTLSVAANLTPGYLSLSAGSTGTGRGAGGPMEMKWLDGHKPLFKITTRLDSTIYAQDLALCRFFQECERQQEGTSSEDDLMAAIKSLETLKVTSLICFQPVLFSRLFQLMVHSSSNSLKSTIVNVLLSLVDELVGADKKDQLLAYVQHIFLTELDQGRKTAVHDDLARLLSHQLHELKQQHSSDVIKFMKHMWFFLETILKSMAQYLAITNKINNFSRKTRYPDDFGWNIKSLVDVVLHCIRERCDEPAAKDANHSLADFVKKAFCFMDRGVMFKIVAKYLEAFSVKESAQLAELKLGFLRIVCDHEHFIPLNLPFPTPADKMEYSLSDDFCKKHFMIGVLLRELESALQYETYPIRKKTIKILRNLLAKHDSDNRYSDPGMKTRIANLYFPLVPMVLEHTSRLDNGVAHYISPMLNATSLASYQPAHNSVSKATSGGSSGGGVLGSVSSMNLSVTPEKHKTAEAKASEKSSKLPQAKAITGGSVLSRIESELSLDVDVSDSGGQATPTTSVMDPFEKMNNLTTEEIRDLLASVMFVLKHVDNNMLVTWWKTSITSADKVSKVSLQSQANGSDRQPSQYGRLMEFFDMLESCLHTFKYSGKNSIKERLMPSCQLVKDSSEPSLQSLTREKPLKKAATVIGAPVTTSSKGKRTSTVSTLSTVSPMSSLMRTPPMPSDEVDEVVKVEGSFSTEVGLIVLNMMEVFADKFKPQLVEKIGDNPLMMKYFSLAVLLLQPYQSAAVQVSTLSALKAFVRKILDVLFKGSPLLCGILCYEALQCCNSRIAAVRAEACNLFYLLMRCNHEHSKGQGFIRMLLQSTIAISKLVSATLDQRDYNLKKSLTSIATFATQDNKMKPTTFPIEVADLMKRLKTVLTATSQMKVHQHDPEKLVDLHYSLAKSLATSPELRGTWLDSMAALHLKYGNYSEVAHCIIHNAGLVAEYLKLKGKYPPGCTALNHISPDVERDERDIKEDKETAKEEVYDENTLISLLENSIAYFNQAERYEMMPEVFKLLQPFYEKNRNFVKMMEVYGQLAEAFSKIVTIMQTDRRYLATYYRVAFYGRVFEDEHEKQYIYKEPKVTTLGEITLRLQKLYIKSFGADTPVHIIQESGKVDVSSLDLEQAHIQITHVQPYFDEAELKERKTKFERENKISRFIFETPFMSDGGKGHGDVSKQCMRKTILTTQHWFPYITKRIEVADTMQFDLTALQVGIEAMEKKTQDLEEVVRSIPPDAKKLQLLLQGSISAQVNQGAQEYANVFLRAPLISQQPALEIQRLKDIYRTFLQVCKDALELNEELIEDDQRLYQEDLRKKYELMEANLGSLLSTDGGQQLSMSNSSTDGFDSLSRNAHRMSSLVFDSISSISNINSNR